MNQDNKTPPENHTDPIPSYGGENSHSDFDILRMETEALFSRPVPSTLIVNASLVGAVVWLPFETDADEPCVDNVPDEIAAWLDDGGAAGAED